MLCLTAIFIITGCEFDNPYVPDFAGSSTLTGRIVVEPVINLSGMDVFLRGQDSFADITNSNGIFHFNDIPPGNYSLEVQKRPYLRESFSIDINKSENRNIGDLNTELNGAIAGTIPGDKMAIIYGEIELVVYVDDIPLILQTDSESDLTIDMSSTESNINIRLATRITVYIDGTTYSALVQDDGQFLVEFIPPGIYSDIRVKLSSRDDSLPIVSGSPVVVKSGQTRVLNPMSPASY